MKFLKQYLAKRRLAKHRLKERARNASWARNRLAQLDGVRRDRFLETFR